MDAAGLRSAGEAEAACAARALDLFGRTAERKIERALIGEYETLVGELLAEPHAAEPRRWPCELASVPDDIQRLRPRQGRPSGQGPAQASRASAAVAQSAQAIKIAAE